MKKTALQLGVLAFLALFLVSCGSKQMYIMEEDGVSSEITLQSKGDKVTKQTAKFKMNYTEAELGNKENAQSFFEILTAKYKDIPGLSYKMNFKDDFMELTMIVDYSKIDFDKMDGIDTLLPSTNKTDANNLKETIKMLEDNGYKKK